MFFVCMFARPGHVLAMINNFLLFMDNENKMKWTSLPFFQVCSEWKEIALVIRDGHFSEDEEHLIDIFDVKVPMKRNFFQHNFKI